MSRVARSLTLQAWPRRPHRLEASPTGRTRQAAALLTSQSLPARWVLLTTDRGRQPHLVAAIHPTEGRRSLAELSRIKTASYSCSRDSASGSRRLLEMR